MAKREPIRARDPVRKRWGQRYQLGVKSLVALDMPFTAVMDTLLLPWDMFRTDSSIKSRVEKSEKATLATNSVIPPAPMPAQ